MRQDRIVFLGIALNSDERQESGIDEPHFPSDYQDCPCPALQAYTYGRRRFLQAAWPKSSPRTWREEEERGPQDAVLSDELPSGHGGRKLEENQRMVVS